MQLWYKSPHVIPLTYSILVPTHQDWVHAFGEVLSLWIFFISGRACDLFICSQMSGSSPTYIDDPDWAWSTPWNSLYTYLPCECWTKEISPPGNEELNRTIDSFLTFLSIVPLPPLPLSGFKRSPVERSEKCVAPWFPGSCLSFSWHRQAAQVRVVLDSPVW